MSAQNDHISLKHFLGMLAPTLLLFPALILLPPWNFRYVEGWLFSLWRDVMIAATLIYMYRKDPDLLAERARPVGKDAQKKWDAILLSGIYVLSIVWVVIMPLDAARFHWSPVFPLWVKVIGALLLLVSLYFIYKATTENTFLSTRVRIQEERKQHVVTTGTYAFVRHPLYFGVLCLVLGGPLLLGSLIGLVISALAVIILVVRIIGEEKMLVNELEGYAEYKRAVKYRLIPFIW